MKRLLCLTVMVALMPASAREPSVRVRCELGIAQQLTSAQPADLAFTLTNVGEEAIQVLSWQTPFEGLKAPMFTLTRNGAEVEYRGPMLKRGAPHAEDYFFLKPGERRQASINLADGWDVEAAGTYTVEYSAQLFDVIAGSASAPRGLDEFNAVDPSCNTVTFTRVR